MALRKPGTALCVSSGGGGLAAASTDGCVRLFSTDDLALRSHIELHSITAGLVPCILWHCCCGHGHNQLSVTIPSGVALSH